MSAYDTYGNLTTNPETGTTAGVVTLAYDLADRTLSITPTGGTASTLVLDALGRVKTRTTGASVDTYSYAGATNNVVRIANAGGSGTTTDSVLDPSGLRFGTKTSGTVAWLLADLHGSVAVGLNQAGTTVSDALRSDGAGMTVATYPGGGSAATKSWKYQGRLDVAASGPSLYDFQAREMSPGLGSFTSNDTVLGSATNPRQLNRYVYAAANPATLTDPDGHCPFCLLLIPVAIGFFAGAGTDAAVQQVTTGQVDVGQSLFSGAIGAVTGGVGAIAQTAVRSVAGAAARTVAVKAAEWATTTVATSAAQVAMGGGGAGEIGSAALANAEGDAVTAAASAVLRKLGPVGRAISSGVDAIERKLGGDGPAPKLSEPPDVTPTTIVQTTGGRRGTAATRAHLDDVRDWVLGLGEGWNHEYGGRSAVDGSDMREEWIQSAQGGTKGSSYPDLSFSRTNDAGDTEWLRINTVDANKAGVMTSREQTNYDRMLENIATWRGDPGILMAIPKGGRMAI